MTSRLMVLTVALMGAAVYLHDSGAPEQLPPRQPLSEIPLELGDWSGRDTAELDPETVAVLAADEYVVRTYATRSGEPAQLFIAYYQSQRQGSAIHSPMNCLPGAGWQPLSTGRLRLTRTGTSPLEINRYVVQKGREKVLVLYWYQSHGRAVASEYWSKVYLVLDGIRLHRTDGALVRVMAPILSSESRAEASAAGLARELSTRLSLYVPD